MEIGFLPLKIGYTEQAHISSVVIKQFHMYLSSSSLRPRSMPTKSRCVCTMVWRRRPLIPELRQRQADLLS